MGKEEHTVNNLTWKIAGQAGDGILNAGLSMFANTCARGGLYAFATAEYPSLIRGGHNHLDVRVSDKPLHSHRYNVDLLVALNQESIDKHKEKIVSGGGIIYDYDALGEQKEVQNGINLYPVPLLILAKEHGGPIMKNTVAIGATYALVDFDLELLNNTIRKLFKKKGDGVINGNIAAAKAGFDFIREKWGNHFPYTLKAGEHHGYVFMSGNEAIAIGAIQAGCKMICAYPMTPASSIMVSLAKFENEAGIVVKQTEDEVAAMNMAIAANYAGVRTMTATSGGGFALMVEAFGMAAQMECPLVIAEAQRPGPGTGMATHTGQGDLRFVMHAGTDEGPRLVIAPGDITQAFFLTIQAFNLAEKYQMPVLILTDKYLGESYKTIPYFDLSLVNIERGELINDPDGLKGSEYVRYKVTTSGISPRTIPGVRGGRHVCTSYEHDEEGNEHEGEENKLMMSQKRFRKFELLKKELPKPELIGAKDAQLTIISWGSTRDPILEAMDELNGQGISVNYLQIIYPNPLHEDVVAEVIKKAKKVVLIENNQTGLLGGVIKEHTGLDVHHKILKYDGRPFFPSEIVQGIAKIAKGTDERILHFSMNRQVANENIGVRG
ncbi:TPA: 2-oxoacid:acceptor oxidoreductase subunit alpha [Candidatus Woesearchaeota archaeon]|nr:2-oxoacid:acceptor oxidoreductase subunit alpha [Candidatus Woesearchaeota archaeon]HII68729.1 2-oxoacid:acceptor oxidoreductase subunit alpha [Candidatus Woesearchaeota archaeon]